MMRPVIANRPRRRLRWPLTAERLPGGYGDVRQPRNGSAALTAPGSVMVVVGSAGMKRDTARSAQPQRGVTGDLARVTRRAGERFVERALGTGDIHDMPHHLVTKTASTKPWSPGTVTAMDNAADTTERLSTGRPPTASLKDLLQEQEELQGTR